MDDFNVNPDLYSSAFWGSDLYPFLMSTMPANEGADDHYTGGTMANYLEPPTSMDDWALAHINYGRYNQQWNPGQYFPEVQVEPVDLSSWDMSLTRPAALESVPTPVSISVPSGNGQSPSTFGTFHTNAEAGPSSLALLRVPFIGAPEIHPSGGVSETTADAETDHNNRTEENKGSSKRTKVPYYRRSRQKLEGQLPILFQWVKKRKGLKRKPFLSESLAAVAKFIPTIRQVVNEEPTFFSRGSSGKIGSERAQREQERRDMERELYRELARYYPQPNGAWKYSELLSKVLEDLEANPASLETPDEPSPSTSTAVVSEPE